MPAVIARGKPLDRGGNDLASFWSLSETELFVALAAGAAGLAAGEAELRARRNGPNLVGREEGISPIRILGRQFASPLVLILIFGAGISLLLRQWADASIILAIVLGSALLTFSQEYRASKAVLALRQRLALTAQALRSGREIAVPVAALVPGDVVLLAAGNLVPADGVILESRDFLVTEAALTGESLPIEKAPGIVPAATPIAVRTNCVFMGSAVRSGTARVLIVRTGLDTVFGGIAVRLDHVAVETDFARGVRRFGGMLLRFMFVIVLGVLTVNQLLERPIAESLLFAVALAVGLSPELLPAIVSITLATGARHLAKGGVIVRRLEAIENLGSMDVLCTDKTGTLTEGTVSFAGALALDGEAGTAARLAGFANAWFETGIANPLDAALVSAASKEGWTPGLLSKVDEIPYDFLRRRLSISVAEPGRGVRMITKGAFADVMAVCTHMKRGGTRLALDAQGRSALEALFRAQGEAGFRVLAIAERDLDHGTRWTREDERDLVFLGLLLFLDPPKADARSAIGDLKALGIDIKVISGDNRHVTAHVAAAVGLDPGALLAGPDIALMSDRALANAAARTTLFAEIDPQQKERLVRALQQTGHTVGFLGDGINDAPALHIADVGVSVEHAVDVARESADVILLRRDLDVLRQGVEDGRRTFANTLKYISITTSANFGNMVSMALATPLLPFLPLLPKQILLNNFLSDFPSMAIASDRVDPEQVARPQRWDVKEVQRFMIVFGLISSCFDLLTFAALFLLLDTSEPVFQTAWFLVSLLTELVVVLVLRTRRAAWRSRPSGLLAWSTALVAVAILMLPWFVPFAALFGFVPLPASLLAAMLAIVAGYVLATEIAKRIYYRRRPRGSEPAIGDSPYFRRPWQSRKMAGRNPLVGDD